MSEEIYDELIKAVLDDDVEKVDSIFKTLPCADVRREMWAEWPFLHYANTAEMTKLILSHGADIEVIDDCGLTPLHSAVKCYKGASVIHELLVNGANVNSTSAGGVTPLTLAIAQKYTDTEAVQELLENGADINFKYNSATRLEFSTPFCNALNENRYCAELIIKIVLRKYFKDFKKIINLEPYRSLTYHQESSEYLKKCVDEIDLMSLNKINKYSTIFEIVVKGYIKPLHLSYDEIEPDILLNYPIYHDVILPQIKKCIERGKLFDKLKDSQLCLLATNTLDKIVILNTDCILKIANYLTNDDLNKFIESL